MEIAATGGGHAPGNGRFLVHRILGAVIAQLFLERLGRGLPGLEVSTRLISRLELESTEITVQARWPTVHS